MPAFGRTPWMNLLRTIAFLIVGLVVWFVFYNLVEHWLNTP
jgi:uncharacterized protein HemY